MRGKQEVGRSYVDGAEVGVEKVFCLHLAHLALHGPAIAGARGTA